MRRLFAASLLISTVFTPTVALAAPVPSVVPASVIDGDANPAQHSRDRDDRRGDWRDRRYDRHANDYGRFERYENRYPGRDDRYRQRTDQRRYDDRRYYDNRYDRRRYDDRGYSGTQNYARWNIGWRRDNRYDWAGYRRQHRDLYRWPGYANPYRGRSYSRFNVGFRLGSPYYQSRYWVNDPVRYRLPSVYGPYRWVRYYNDVLLVDTRSGFINDAVYSFFW